MFIASPVMLYFEEKYPIPEFKESIKLAKKYKNVEILWASTREPYNFLEATKLKCHIITVPPSIIEKIEKFGKSFKELSKDTVKAVSYTHLTLPTNREV